MVLGKVRDTIPILMEHTRSASRLSKALGIVITIFGVSLILLKFGPDQVKPFAAVSVLLSFLLLALLFHFVNVAQALLMHFALYSLISSGLVQWDLFRDYTQNLASTKIFLGFLLMFYLCLVASLMFLAYKVLIMAEPQPPKERTLLNRLDYTINYIAFGSSFIIVIFLYILLVVFTVIGFGALYEQYNNSFINFNEGLYYASPELNGGRRVATGWDVLYFSSVTLFTVGYGDIVPIGDTLKLLVQAEMVLGHLINIIIPAIVFNALVAKVVEKLLRSKAFDN